MEQQNKYYTPDISELYVGYMCEERWGENFPWQEITIKNEDWLNRAWSYLNKVVGQDSGVGIRTKYLDKEDIENCEWKPDGNDTDGWKKYYIFIGNISWYLYHGYNNEILITKYKEHNSKGTFYDGECKSINELRKIMQWLNIK